MRESYPKYKPTGIPWLPDMPEHWDLVGFNILFKDNKVKNKGMKESQVLSLSYGNIIRKKRGDNFGLIPESFETYQIVNPGYIVLRLTDLQNDKRSLRVGYVKEKGIITSAYTGLIPGKVESHYYYYLLHYLDIRKHFYSLGGGVRQSSDYNEVKKEKVPLPTIEEQTAIANYLDTKSAQINKFVVIKEKLIESLREQRQGIINKAIIQGINSKAEVQQSNVDWLRNIPKHWKVRRLRFVGNCQNGMNKDGEFFGSGFPFMSYSDVYKNEHLPSSLSGLAESTKEDRETYSVLEGDVFFTRTSETIEEIGFASTCTQSISDATFSGFLIRFRPRPNILLPEFSKYYFRSNLIRKAFIKDMNIITRASLSQNLVKNLPVLIPPISEQQEIVNYIQSETKRIDIAISRIETEIEKVKELKQSLIAEVVTGKIKIV